LKLKLLYKGQKYQIAATYDGDTCPVDDFLKSNDASIQANLDGMTLIIEHVANNGFQNLPPKWCHEANKKKQIYEFIKGPFRVFFFKGEAETIAVCVCHVRKSRNKADKASVNYASEKRKEYENAIKANSVELIEEE
jgi:hypothetical protein